MKLVVIESPFAGDTERNLRYCRAAMRDCLLRGESPYASHALLTQPGVLDDSVPADRELGIAAGFAWRAVAAATVVYTDLGVTEGMRRGIADAVAAGRVVEERTFPGWDRSTVPLDEVTRLRVAVETLASCVYHDGQQWQFQQDATDEELHAAIGAAR